MSSVDLAEDYARRLVMREASGPGDLEAAMRRIEVRHGIGYWTLWGLWNRRRKSIAHGLFVALRGAYLATCERQATALADDLAAEKAKGGGDADLAALETAVATLAAKIAAARARLK